MDSTIPRLDAREQRAWRGLHRAHDCLSKALDTRLDAAHGLPLTSYEVLLHLSEADEGRMRMHDLASSVMLSRSGLTRLADRLEREGYLERCSCAHDARGAFAVLTPAGREKLEAARETYLITVRELFVRHFSPEELDRLNEAWNRILGGVCR